MQVALLMGAKESFDAAMIVKEGKWTLNFWKINFQAWTAQGKLTIVKRKLSKRVPRREMKRSIMEITWAKIWNLKWRKCWQWQMKVYRVTRWWEASDVNELPATDYGWPTRTNYEWPRMITSVDQRLIITDRRTMRDSSSRRIVRLVSVFIRESHNQTSYKSLPKSFQTDNAP